MYNVLIVDDEQEIRTGLKLKIDWAGMGFFVAGEAKDGQEALDKLEDTAYDLMITDIKMPVMSGLELLKRCSVKYPFLKVIVLSGFDDFHFVKAALQCGARDYMLKPVVRSEMKEIILKVRDEIDEDRKKQTEHSDTQWRLSQSLSAVREQLMLALISDEGEEHLLPLRSDIAMLQLTPLMNEEALIRFLCVEIRSTANRFETGEGQSGLFRLAFQMLSREIVENSRLEQAVFAFPHPSYPNIMHYLISSDTAEESEDRIKQLAEQVHETLRLHLKVETVIAVGELHAGLSSVRQAFLSALTAWSRSQAGAITQTIYADNVAYPAEKLLPEVEKRLLILLEDAELDRFVHTIENMLQSRKVSLQDIYSFMLRVVLLLDQAVTKNGLPIGQTQDWIFPITQWSFTTHQSAVAYLKELAMIVTEGIKRSRASGGTAVAEAVRQYIDAHYMNEISLSMLADRFHINTTYLSELFKKQFGSTFSEYLVQARIRKASELLADPNLRLADIAELVGFANASYLSSVFKKMYGVSPNEYRTQRSEDQIR
ncbi:response regulator [Paenibacillus sp. BC26]|uniref:response regulator transcription factor n=1 Tax=Paenibacillus sp. BC26 TaxID=1881032 RepID=UPI0008EB1688|nr:response regulator [Paenibacillus sp. BC26]SFT24337.1 two-component system, response regulator YesN [Paenibacillus sp. BC26]